MEAGFIVMAIILIVAAVAGLCVIVKKRLISGSKTKDEGIHGMLNIVYDEFSENPQLMLALYDPIEEVVGQKQVVFEVNIIKQNSQK